MTTESPREALPKAALIEFDWSWSYFYFAKFRLANAVRLQVGWLVIQYRAPWLEHSARTLHPELYPAQPEAQTDE